MDGPSDLDELRPAHIRQDHVDQQQGDGRRVAAQQTDRAAAAIGEQNPIAAAAQNLEYDSGYARLILDDEDRLVGAGQARPGCGGTAAGGLRVSATSGRRISIVVPCPASERSATSPPD